MAQTDELIMRVGTHTDVKALAGAIANAVRESGRVEMSAIGAGSVNQAVKAVAIARGYTISSGWDLNIVPSFFDTTTETTGDVTAIRLVVNSKKL